MSAPDLSPGQAPDLAPELGPELGPLLGRVAVPEGPASGLVPLDDIRLTLVTGLFELARFSEEVQAEDAQICEAVQFNLHSRAYRSGPYSPKRESGVRLFHALMHNS